MDLYSDAIDTMLFESLRKDSVYLWEQEATDETPAQTPAVRISTELSPGDIGAYKFMGQTKTIGDPTDKKVLDYFKKDLETSLGGDPKSAENYAKFTKNYAMHSFLDGELKAQITEQDGTSSINRVVAKFTEFLGGEIKDKFDEYVQTQKDLYGATQLVEELIVLESQKLEQSNKKSMKEKEKAANLTKNYKVYARLYIKLASTLKEALMQMIKQGKQKLATATTLNEDKLVEIVVDFNEIRKKEINESFLAMFGGWVEQILKAMFGGFNIPVSIRGSDREVQAFAAAIGSEKRYIDVARRYGLDHPSTYRSKAQLDAAASNFKRETGIEWPFK